MISGDMDIRVGVMQLLMVLQLTSPRMLRVMMPPISASREDRMRMKKSLMKMDVRKM